VALDANVPGPPAPANGAFALDPGSTYWIPMPVRAEPPAADVPVPSDHGGPPVSTPPARRGRKVPALAPAPVLLVTIGVAIAVPWTSMGAGAPGASPGPAPLSSQTTTQSDRIGVNGKLQQGFKAHSKNGSYTLRLTGANLTLVDSSEHSIWSTNR